MHSDSILKTHVATYIIDRKMTEKIDVAAARFVDFLREAVKYGTLHDYHMIFKSGTVLRMSENNIPEAIKLLTDDEFPTVGDAKFDRISIPGEPYPEDTTKDILWIILWPYKSPVIKNIVISCAAEPLRAATMAAECRRIDFTDLEPYMIIAPDLTTTLVKSN